MQKKVGVDLLKFEHIHVCHSSELGSKFSNLQTMQRWPFFTIIFSIGEQLNHCIENDKVHVPPNTFLFIGPDRYHSFIENEADDYWLIMFDYGFYAKTPGDAYFIQNTPLFSDLTKIYVSRPSIDIGEYVKLQLIYMEKMLGQLKNPLVVDILHNAVQAILLRSNFYQLGLQRYGVQVSSSEDKRIATQFREILHDHYRKEKKLDYYADALNINPRRLNQAITNIHGRSAKQFVTEKIFEESKSLLAHSAMTIKEISFYIGFSEENNFSTFFTKHAGYSPKKYRNLQMSLSES